MGGMSGVLCFCSLISGPSMVFDKMAQNFAAHVLKSSKGNLFQCLTVVIFLYIFFEPHFVLHPWSLVLPPCSPYKSLLVNMGRMLLHPPEAAASPGQAKPSCQGFLWRTITPRPALSTTSLGDGLSLNSCQFTNAFLFWVFQNWVQYSNYGLMTDCHLKNINYLSPTPASTPASASQNTVILCCQVMLLTHI